MRFLGVGLHVRVPGTFACPAGHGRAIHGSIRFSLSRYNTQAEIDRVLAVLPPVIAGLRALSPFWARREKS